MAGGDQHPVSSVCEGVGAADDAEEGQGDDDDRVHADRAEQLGDVGALSAQQLARRGQPAAPW